MKKRIRAAVLCAVLVFCLAFSSCSDNEDNELKLILQDRSGSVFFETGKDIADERLLSYADLVIKEVNEISYKKTDGPLYVKTALDSEIVFAAAQAYETLPPSVPFAAVVMGEDGEILCSFSAGGEENFALEKTQPYSSIKPLSVYAPAMEKGEINWASRFSDSPVKKIVNENGEEEDWPVNGIGKYSYEDVYLSDAIKASLNTTAVRCLQQTGVLYCMNFLADKFSVDVRYEKEQAALNGEEEVLHNIALGYLTAGVSPVDMAGYYRIFSCSGKYIKPYSVSEITDEKGKVIYRKEDSEEKQLISEETAFIMNKLLQGTIERGGTAQAAALEGIPIGGKTGTGSEFVGNWFVGFSPQYTFSIWHGRFSKNMCSEIFPALAKGMYFDKKANYPDCENVNMKVYCKESGCAFSTKCGSLARGYFISDVEFADCPLHK